MVWFTFAMKTLAGGLIGIASQTWALQAAPMNGTGKANSAKLLVKKLYTTAAIQFKLADMATKIDTEGYYV